MITDRCSQELDQYCFDHETTERNLIETHISRVILTGPFAYKIKKPVDLGFVNYTCLEQRKRFCDLELELNRRFAPELYLDVVPVFEHENRLLVGAEFGEKLELSGKIIDYAVKMRQFPQNSIAANCLSSLTSTNIEDFGWRLARFHDGIESAIPTAEFAQPTKIVSQTIENFEVLADAFTRDWRSDAVEQLCSWSQSACDQLKPNFIQRLNAGRVKQCHGDLHLKNLILRNDRLIPFDGIEFNEQFRFVDVLCEIAFPVMDFFARGKSMFAWRLLNAYLEESGEYDDLALLRFYLVYRAMVRAKVAWLNPNNHTKERFEQYTNQDFPDDLVAGPWDKYLKTAYYFAFELSPQLTITHGFSGSGKSTLAMQRIEKTGGIRIRSDVLRSRLARKFNIKEKYSGEMNNWIYSHMAGLCRDGLIAGFPIIADATFLEAERRANFRELATSVGTKFNILDCQASYDVLVQRILNRSNDASEANIEVLENQMKNHDPLSNSEKVESHAASMT